MIDTKTEQLIHLPDAVDAFPGRTVTVQTLDRWRKKGARGIKLETILVGGLRYTSAPAIDRFVNALNAEVSTCK